jgi:FHA domain/Domain of unknown function (DUF1707)
MTQALEQQRDETLGALAAHYAAGHVRTGTLEHRVEQTMRARSVAALRDAVWDLPPLGRSLLRALTARFEREGATRIAFRTAAATLDIDLAGGPRTYVVGRSRSCDVVLTDPAVSRRHAEISVRGDRCSIRNLASMNGTQVNGLPVTTAVLHAGDVVSFGAAVDAFVR